MSALSPYRGIFRSNNGKRWRARVAVPGAKPQYAPGYYAAAEEAARAYDGLALRLEGEAATLNFPEEHGHRNPPKTASAPKPPKPPGPPKPAKPLKPPQQFRSDASAEEARAKYAYDPDTGDLSFRGGWKAGRRAGFTLGRGYRGVWLRDRSYFAHRVIWLIVQGAWPDGEVDHLNGCRSDNRWANLRDVPKSLNGHNRPVRRDSRSGVKGVFERDGRWRAQIVIAGVVHNLGSHPTKEAASDAYRRAAAQHLPACPNAG